MTRSDFYPRRLSDAARHALLRSMVERCHHRAGEPPPVIVFDLDGTLLDNRPRVARIFHELGEHWEAKHPVAARQVSEARASSIVYGLRENMELLGVTDDALVDEAFAFWKERFFADAYMRFDEETRGARAFVRACYDAGATIVYLTGRDLPNMAVGTFASLRDVGFPIGVVGTSLVTKPAFEIPDAEFKNDVAPALGRHGHVVAAFDNEPANNNLFKEHHPAAESVFLDTHHAPNPPRLHDAVIVIDSFSMDD